ncbi:sensor histidine kinase [Spirillospora sp. CA-294931]|uniref:sensor histidine kinase n=1 Tax=Spirillospora sp. CA-294931 TaxID=3240042 RepID=UPI003D8AA3EA
MGVRLRTTLAATCTVAVALGLAALALFWALNASLEKSTREVAESKAEAAAGALTHNSVDVAPDTQVVISGPLTGISSWQDGTGRYTVAQTTVATPGGTVTVQGRASLAPADHAMATLRNLLIPGVPLLLALVALLTWAAVGRALKPVSAIRAKVADITANDLHERVPEPGSQDEIGALARTVNRTFDRLQTAVEAHRQFVADAAHELRSPLTILRTRLELAGDTEALADVDRLTSLTTDLLLLARLDAGEPRRDQQIDLAQLVAEEATRKRPRPEIKVTLNLTPDLLVQGSPDQLGRLVANLVDNAVRHAHTTVGVRLTPSEGEAVLDVTDDGPGIPDEHREKVFDRFTRLDHARTRDKGGSGLGLAIARDIATSHQGTLTLADHPQGTRMQALLPLSPTAEAEPTG